MNIKGKNWADRQRTKIARQNDINRLTHENERLKSDNENLRRYITEIQYDKLKLKEQIEDRVHRYEFEHVQRSLNYFEKAYNDVKNDAYSQKKISEQLRMYLDKSIKVYFFLGFAFACIVIYLIFF